MNATTASTRPSTASPSSPAAVITPGETPLCRIDGAAMVCIATYITIAVPTNATTPVMTPVASDAAKPVRKRRGRRFRIASQNAIAPARAGQIIGQL